MENDMLMLVSAALAVKRERYLLRHHGLSVEEYLILRLLVLAGGWLPTSQAADLIQVQLPRMTVLARMLERAGWIVRERIPHDRRSFAMVLCEARRDDLDRLVAELERWESELRGILAPCGESLTQALTYLGVLLPDGRAAPLL